MVCANYDMAFYNYHYQAKKLIKENHLVKVEMLDEYHGISPCMLLHFDNHNPMPIREDYFDEYMKLIQE